MILEGDSMVVVQAARNNSISTWHLGNLLVCVNEQLNALDNFKICHVYRETNREVNTLSKWVVGFLEEGMSSFERCSRREGLGDND